MRTHACDCAREGNEAEVVSKNKNTEMHSGAKRGYAFRSKSPEAVFEGRAPEGAFERKRSQFARCLREQQLGNCNGELRNEAFFEPRSNSLPIASQ